MSDIFLCYLCIGVFFTGVAQVSLLIRLSMLWRTRQKKDGQQDVSGRDEPDELGGVRQRRETEAMMDSYYNGISSIISYKGPGKKQDG